MTHSIPADLLKKFHSIQTQTNSLFITFEGIEGAGKSHQIQLLKDYFETQDKKVSIFREPGSTTFGESLRQAILNSQDKLHPIAEAYLIASARSQLLYQKICPLLAEENNVVICDRYIDSSLVYQGIARGLGLERIIRIHEPAPLNLFPHITFYLKIDRETSLERQAARNLTQDYFESESKSFYQNIINGFDSVAEIFPNRIKVINGIGSAQYVYGQIIESLKSLKQK